MEVSQKWQFHFLTIWQARGTTCLYHPRLYHPRLYHPRHIGRNQYEYFAEKPMWEICFERGAKSIFRLSGEIFSTDREKGDDVHCLRRSAPIGRYHIFPNGYKDSLEMIAEGYGLE